jgi:hypothetical protein
MNPIVIYLMRYIIDRQCIDRNEISVYLIRLMLLSFDFTINDLGWPNHEFITLSPPDAQNPPINQM